MADSSSLIDYNDDSYAKMYDQWGSATLKEPLTDNTAIEYFAPLEGKTLIDFGCGTGCFMEKCVAEGMDMCLGVDANAAIMRTKGYEIISDQDFEKKWKSHKKGEICFVVKNCFEPFDRSYGHFDLAICQFVIHYIQTEDVLRILLKNILDSLKPGGIVYIGQNPYVADSVKDQEFLIKSCGYLQPMREDSQGQDPFFFEEPVYKPSKTTTGRPFTREKFFAFPCYFWSNEKIMENLRKVGFVNVRLVESRLPDGVGTEEEREGLAELGVPFVSIGADRPM